MKQIVPISLTSPPVGTHLEFHTQVNKYLLQATAAALHVEAQAAQYAALLEQEAAIVNRPSSQRYTQQLADADLRRDHGAGVLMNIIKAQVRSLDNEKKTAALQLKSIIDSYRNVGDQSYMKETAQLRGLVEALRSAGNAPLVTVLGLDAEVDLLEEANTAFEELHRLSQADAQQRQALEAIVVNAFAIASPSDALNTFIDSVNGLIYRTQQEDNHSHSTGDGSTPDPGTDTPEPEPEPDEPGGDEGEGGSPL